MAAGFAAMSQAFSSRAFFRRLPDDNQDGYVNDDGTASDVLSINEPLDFQSRVVQFCTLGAAWSLLRCNEYGLRGTWATQPFQAIRKPVRSAGLGIHLESGIAEGFASRPAHNI